MLAIYRLWLYKLININNISELKIDIFKLILTIGNFNRCLDSNNNISEFEKTIELLSK
jgi:hypothetical protein